MCFACDPHTTHHPPTHGCGVWDVRDMRDVRDMCPKHGVSLDSRTRTDAAAPDGSHTHYNSQHDVGTLVFGVGQAVARQAGKQRQLR